MAPPLLTRLRRRAAVALAALRLQALQTWHDLRGWHDWKATRVTERASLRGPFRTIRLECHCGAWDEFTEPAP